MSLLSLLLSMSLGFCSMMSMFLCFSRLLSSYDGYHDDVLSSVYNEFLLLRVAILDEYVSL